MSAIARRYGRAAIEAAEDAGGNKAVQALASDARAFSNAFDGSAELREVLLNPAFKAQRTAVLDSVLDKVVSSDAARRLVVVLTQADRIRLLGEVVSEVQRIADAKAGKVRATVQSAIKLSKEQRGRIGAALSKRLGREVELEVEVDPEILGGLVCRVGDLSFDGSLKRQLELMRERLTTGAH